LPARLYIALFPLVFFVTCTLAVGPAWDIQERQSIRLVKDVDSEIVPIVVKTNEGKFSIASLGDLGNAKSVKYVSAADEKTINRDLCDSLGWNGRNYRFFQVLGHEGDTTQVSAEFPTVHDAKLKGWYSLRQGTLTPERILHYGPSFAMDVMPFTFAAGIAGVGLYMTLVKRRNKSPAAPAKT
jgi:hypothetical protein